MAYIGRQLVRGQNRVLDDISSSFNGSTTAFNLTVSSSSSPPASVNQLWIILGGILQKPGTDFTVADAVITFTTAPASTLSFWGMIQGDTSDINSPADASVTPSKIANSGDFAFPADVRFNDADGSHYVGLQAPSTVSSNLVWTLPAADGSANQLLKTDGSGALGWASDTQSNLLDEDNMSSNSATQPASQQSIKAYADTKAVLTGSTNNTITTVTGANAIQGEGNLTFDGANLGITAANDTAKLTFLRTGTTIGGSINTRDESSDKGLTYIAKDGNSGVPNHVFQTDAGSGASEVFRIQSNGNASIGGIAPVPTDAAYNKALLHIHQTQSGTYGSELHLTNNTTGSAAGDGMFLSMWTDNDVYFTNQEDGDINFTTNGHQALQIQSNKNVKITDGNLIIDTAGHGIDFSASSHATGMTSEVLDSYEEGTWTPTLTFGGGNTGITYATTTGGSYVKIGRQVIIHGRLKLDSKGSSTGAAVIGGLPFTCGNVTSGTSGIEGDAYFTYIHDIVGSEDHAHITGFVDQSSTEIDMKWNNDSGDTENIEDSDFESSTSLSFGCTYPAA